jgi:hypothetical protein
MSISSDQKLTVKLFIGYHLTSDIRMYLKQSIAWKQAKITKESSLRDLLEAHFQDKDYIGKYITQEGLTIQELKQIESSVRESLVYYCPELSQETLKIYLFPQIFIS